MHHCRTEMCSPNSCNSSCHPLHPLMTYQPAYLSFSGIFSCMPFLAWMVLRGLLKGNGVIMHHACSPMM